MEKQSRVIAVAEDLDQRGIVRGDLIPKLEFVSRGERPGLLSQYERVWHW